MPSFSRSSLLATLLGVAFAARPSRAVAQTTTGSIAGTVREADSGHALVHALVLADRSRAESDSLGRFSLGELPAGTVHVRVRAIGFHSFDTTLAVAGHGQTRLDLRLEPDPSMRALRSPGEQDVTAGRIDSSARGLLHRTPADSSLTFDAFGARLLAATARQRGLDSNTVLSPTSAAFALSVALLGARGPTETEMASALGVAALDRATLRRRTAVAMSAGTGRSDVQLDIANAIWVDTTVRLAPDFVAAAASYHASARAVQLSAPSAVDAVNAWADSATHGKISKVLRDPLPDSARLFIANAVYFNGKWLDEFDKSETRQRDFRLASGTTVQVTAMERTGHIGYRRGTGYQMVRLPYRGGRFAMYVALPDSGTSAAAVEQEFAEHGWPPSLVTQDFRDVHLAIPRLHLAESYDLTPVLSAIGIRRALDCDVADFQSMVIARNPQRPEPLCISKVSQTVYLDVDEKGTEAAAVTGLLIVTATALAPPPIEFIVDRPFLFMLRDEQTGANLFVGTIRRP